MFGNLFDNEQTESDEPHNNAAEQSDEGDSFGKVTGLFGPDGVFGQSDNSPKTAPPKKAHQNSLFSDDESDDDKLFKKLTPNLNNYPKKKKWETYLVADPVIHKKTFNLQLADALASKASFYLLDLLSQENNSGVLKDFFSYAQTMKIIQQSAMYEFGERIEDIIVSFIISPAEHRTSSTKCIGGRLNIFADDPFKLPTHRDDELKRRLAFELDLFALDMLMFFEEPSTTSRLGMEILPAISWKALRESERFGEREKIHRLIVFFCHGDGEKRHFLQLAE